MKHIFAPGGVFGPGEVGTCSECMYFREATCGYPFTVRDGPRCISNRGIYLEPTEENIILVTRYRLGGE